MKQFLCQIPFEIWLLLIWILLILLIDPSGEFPVNDDFAYSRNVWYLSEEGRFQFSDWPGMTLIFQTIIGAVAASLFGFSFLTLRMCTLLFALGFLLLLDRFLILLGLSKKRAFFVLLVVLFNPFFLSLSFTFMTEIYFLFFLLAGLLGYGLFLKKAQPLYLLLFAFSALAATLIRQTGLILALTVCLAEGLRLLQCWTKAKCLHSSGSTAGVGPFQKLPPVWSGGLAVLVLLLCYGALRAFEFWAIRTDNLSVNYGRAGDLFELLKQEKPDYFMRKAGILLMYAGLFLLPLNIRLIPSLRPAEGRAARFLQAGLVVFLAVLAVMGLPEFPRPNVFYNLGLGPKLLKDSYWDENISPRMVDQAWQTLRYLALAAGLLLVLVLGQSVHWKWPDGRRGKDHRTYLHFTLWLLIGGFTGYLLLNRFFFDRYTLPFVVTGAMLLGMLPGQVRPVLRFAGFGLLGIVGLFSTLAVRDYMEWQRTRWAALDYLIEQREIDPRRIDGGLEFNGWYETGPFNPAQKGEKSWWFVMEDEYVVACGLIEGFDHIKSFSYRRWLWPATDSLLILRHDIPVKKPYESYPLRCDCELLAENTHYLLSTDGQVRFEGGGLRSDLHARSGRYSVQLDAQQPYGFLYRFIDVEPGETFLVRIWKYGNAPGIHIVSGGGSGCHTVMSEQVIRTDEYGWQLMELQTTIPEGFACHHYGIYMWNSGEGEVWLDDLEITRMPGD